MKVLSILAISALTASQMANAHNAPTLPEVLKETVKGGEVVVSLKGGYEHRSDDGKLGTQVSKTNNGDGIVGAELQYQKGKYAVGLEHLDGSNAYNTKAYNLNAYRYFEPKEFADRAKPYVLGGIGHLETNRIDQTPTLQVGAGVKFLPKSSVSPKLEIRHTYGIDDRTQDTAVLAALDLNATKLYKLHK